MRPSLPAASTSRKDHLLSSSSPTCRQRASATAKRQSVTCARRCPLKPCGLEPRLPSFRRTQVPSPTGCRGAEPRRCSRLVENRRDSAQWHTQASVRPPLGCQRSARTAPLLSGSFQPVRGSPPRGGGACVTRSWDVCPLSHSGSVLMNPGRARSARGKSPGMADVCGGSGGHSRHRRRRRRLLALRRRRGRRDGHSGQLRGILLLLRCCGRLRCGLRRHLLRLLLLRHTLLLLLLRTRLLLLLPATEHRRNVRHSDDRQEVQCVRQKSKRAGKQTVTRARVSTTRTRTARRRRLRRRRRAAPEHRGVHAASDERCQVGRSAVRRSRRRTRSGVHGSRRPVVVRRRRVCKVVEIQKQRDCGAHSHQKAVLVRHRSVSLHSSPPSAFAPNEVQIL
eukprot:Rhum_TRINITY_DN14766_c9_g1::Rhum_TRINITY_DN14766_c9_g1_i3::g.115063::m.115063